jgi:hypothetical protein
MIDPASAIGLGSGAGAIIGTAMRFLNSRSQAKLDQQKEQHEHERLLSGKTTEHQESLQIIDKGEPFKIKLWGFEYSGTKPDRIMPPAFNGQLWLLTATYCGAVLICFLCADIAILQRPIEGSPNVFELFFGIIKHTRDGRVIYIQTLGGVGAALLTTASVILTASIIGIYDRKR